MIQSNELRIGNFIKYEFYDKKEIVDFCENDLRYITSNIDRYEPIQLTEQWLIDFGFVKQKVNIPEAKKTIVYFSLDNFGMFYDEETKTMGLNFIDSQETIIKHVHQLQNLYFALTGKELNKQ